MTTNNTKKNENYFVCECCDFETSKKTDYSRHILTMKHKNNVSTTDDNKKNDKKYCFKTNRWAGKYVFSRISCFGPVPPHRL